MSKLIAAARGKFQEIVLLLVSLLVLLQLLVGTILDLWFGILIVVVIWVYMKVNNVSSTTNGAPKE